DSPCLQRLAEHSDQHAFPTRRSSDLSTGPYATTCRTSTIPRRQASPCACCSRTTADSKRSRRSSASSADASSTWSRSTRGHWNRSEEHTSELQSRENLVCRLLLEKKK